MKDIDWSKAPKGATAIKIDGQKNIYFVDKMNTPYLGESLTNGSHPLGWEVIAIRPKPPLTKEQMEAVREYVKWLKAEDLCLYPVASVDKWLKVRGGEQ